MVIFDHFWPVFVKSGRHRVILKTFKNGIWRVIFLKNGQKWSFSGGSPDSIQYHLKYIKIPAYKGCFEKPVKTVKTTVFNKIFLPLIEMSLRKGCF